MLKVIEYDERISEMNPIFQSKPFHYLLLSFIPVYGVFLSLPYVTNVGHKYLGETAIRAEKEMRIIATGIEKLHQQYQCYPNAPASHFINDATLIVEGRAISFTQSNIPRTGLYDPFIAGGFSQPYRYYSDGVSWFVLACNGPDEDEDINQVLLQKITKPSSQSLRPWTYDPHNGYQSGGDVIVCKTEAPLPME